MHGYVANTDFDWFSFLASRPDLEEVNFWQPSGRTRFGAIEEGSPFFFRLKAPHRAIGGFGIYVGNSILPAWLAWETFGEANGAPDFPTMCRRVERYRRDDLRGRTDQANIGCLMIAAPTFFPTEQWVTEPADWASQIVRGKTFDLRSSEGRRIFKECRVRAPSSLAIEDVISPPDGLVASDGPRYAAETIIRPRLGQGSFKIAVADAYNRACAVTTEHSLPVLDAAHIRPYKLGGEHRVSNGILLRTDIHRLFDAGYVTVTPEHRFEVSARLREDYENGRSYYGLHGHEVHVPPKAPLQPDSALLDWHNRETFRT